MANMNKTKQRKQNIHLSENASIKIILKGNNFFFQSWVQIKKKVLKSA